MRVLWGLAVLLFSIVFDGVEVLATRRGVALSETSKRIIFQRLPQNAGSALLELLTSDKTNSAWIVFKDPSLGDDKWKRVNPVAGQDRVATSGEMSEFILNNLAWQNAQDKQLLEESDLHLYIAVPHTPTLLSIYETVTDKWPYKIDHVAHIDLAVDKELVQLPRAFVLERALEGTDSFSPALEKLLFLYGMDLDTFSQQLHAAKNTHSGLFSGLIAELTRLQQLDLADLNSSAGVGEETIHVLPSPYVEDIDQLARAGGNSPAERNEQQRGLRLLASTELVMDDIEALLQEFDAGTVIPPELEQLMHEINATKSMAEATPVPETTTATKPQQKETPTGKTTQGKMKKESKKLPAAARPYGEFIELAFSRLTAKSDGNKYTAVWLSRELAAKGFSVPRKTIDNHKNFWSIPSRDYLQKMIDAGLAELIDVDRETLWKVWELSQQARDKEKVARKFGELLSTKRTAAGYKIRRELITAFIQDSGGDEWSQERFRELENKLSSYEGHKILPTATTLKQLLHAGFADKIGVSAEELETAWREARQARAEAKKMAKTARALARETFTVQEPPVVAAQPVAVVEADPVPVSTETGKTTPIIVRLIANLQQMLESSPSATVAETLKKELKRLEDQWLIEEEQRQASAEKEAKTALEKVRADFEQEIAAVRERYSEQLGRRLDEIYREVMRGW